MPLSEDEISDAVRRAARTKEKRLNISLLGVAFLSSETIHVFVRGNKLAKSLGVDVGFVNVSPSLIEVFKITKLNELFRIEGETH